MGPITSLFIDPRNTGSVPLCILIGSVTVSPTHRSEPVEDSGWYSLGYCTGVRPRFSPVLYQYYSRVLNLLLDRKPLCVVPGENDQSIFDKREEVTERVL